MVTITEDTIRTATFEIIYDSLTASLSTGTVTASFIDDNPTFPQVVINPASVKFTKNTFTNANRERFIEVEVVLYCKKNKEIDQITDEIDADLRTNESSLLSSGLIFDDLEDSNEDTFFYNDKKIHTKGIMLRFRANV